MDRIGIDHAQLIADEALRRKQHRLGDEGRVERRIVKRVGHRIDHRAVIGAALHRARHQRIQHQLLHRLVAREGIVFVPRQEGEIGGGTVTLDRHRRGETAVDRQHRPLGNALEHDRLVRLFQQHQPLRPQRLPRLRAEQPHAQRQHHRLLVRLAGRRRHLLRQPQRGAATLVRDARRHARRPGLAVPQAETGEVDTARLFHAGDKILAGRRSAVEAIEIEVAAGAERDGSEDRRHHADQLGALVVDRGGVEVRDFQIALGPHRMRQRPGILRELAGAQAPHVLDPLHRGGALVGREALVAEYGEAFLEA